MINYSLNNSQKIVWRFFTFLKSHWNPDLSALTVINRRTQHPSQFCLCYCLKFKEKALWRKSTSVLSYQVSLIHPSRRGQTNHQGENFQWKKLIWRTFWPCLRCCYQRFYRVACSIYSFFNQRRSVSFLLGCFY